jgi:multidrug resistance efflux pump
MQQVLVRLDDRDVRAAADHAQAVLKQRTAMLASLRAKYALQQSTIRQAAAEMVLRVFRNSPDYGSGSSAVA